MRKNNQIIIFLKPKCVDYSIDEELPLTAKFLIEDNVELKREYPMPKIPLF